MNGKVHNLLDQIERDALKFPDYMEDLRTELFHYARALKEKIRAYHERGDKKLIEENTEEITSQFAKLFVAYRLMQQAKISERKEYIARNFMYTELGVLTHAGRQSNVGYQDKLKVKNNNHLEILLTQKDDQIREAA